MAQAEGYRARSAYKLIEINRKSWNRLLRPGMAVMECGCAPGAWTQVKILDLDTSKNLVMTLIINNIIINRTAFAT